MTDLSSEQRSPSIPLIDVTGDLREAMRCLDEMVGHMQRLAGRIRTAVESYEASYQEKKQ